jgi:cyclophilin family peptidyl-prolyl cis-trans isomerase
VPTEKRARQKAARRKKRAAQVRRVRLRRRLRAGGFVVGGAAIVLVVALASAGVFSGGSPSAKTADTQKAKTAKHLSKDQRLQAQANRLAVAAGCPSTPKTRVNTKHWSSPPPMTIDPTRTYTATVKTTAGTFTIGLDAKAAPHTVNNFVFLADQHFYNCVIFHRVIPGFMDQTGDPTGTGSGGPGYEFANENVPSAYQAGDVAMANSGPNTNGSQFFIVVPGGASQLKPTYSLFGTVTSGMPVVEKINREGNPNPSANGVPPAVIQRILTVTIHES